MIQENKPQALLDACEKFGISSELIQPLDKSTRLRKLSSILGRTDVAYPIDSKASDAYFGLAAENVPFGIGSLTPLTVDLQSFADHQVYESLTWEDHLSWATLVKSQQLQKHQYACQEYLDGEKKFEIRGTTIPDYYILNARIYQQTGWQLATVNEIIPAHVFFHCHSRKFFPVTTFMRPLGTDYLEEPDIGHDIAGHVATFTIPEVAYVMNQHGLANNIIHREKEEKLSRANSDEERQAIEAEATELLLYAGRLYWFTVEFGLVLQSNGLKVFGAGILSSPGETCFSVDSSEPNRVIIDPSNDRDLLRLATTDYLISEFQKTYFVLKDFESLGTLTSDRIISIVKQAIRLPHHTWREVVPGDNVLNIGRGVMGPGEKYRALKAGDEIDECLTRAARRNIEIMKRGPEIHTQEEQTFVDLMPQIPSELLTP